MKKNRDPFWIAYGFSSSGRKVRPLMVCDLNAEEFDYPRQDFGFVSFVGGEPHEIRVSDAIVAVSQF